MRPWFGAFEMRYWLNASYFGAFARYRREYHHYVYGFAGAVNAACQKAGRAGPIEGILENLPWSTFEPQQGVYDFSALRTALDWCRAADLKFALKVNDKGWQYPPFKADYIQPWPAELSLTEPLEFNNAHIAQGEFGYCVQRSHSQVYVPKRWHPEVRSAYRQMIRTLVSELGNHPAWYALLSPETSLGIRSERLAESRSIGYPGPQAYADLIIDTAQALKGLLKGPRLFWALNWIPPDKDPVHHNRVAQALATAGVGLEAVDIWPASRAYTRLVYPQLPRFPRELTWTNITGETVSSGLSLDEALKFARMLDIGHLGAMQQPAKAGFGWLEDLIPRLLA